MKALLYNASLKGAVLSAFCQKCGKSFEYFYKGGALRQKCDVCNIEIARIRKRRENHKRDKKTPAGIAARQRLNRRREQIQYNLLKDWYVKNCIHIQTGLSFRDITEEMIQEKRKQLYARKIYLRAKKEITL